MNNILMTDELRRLLPSFRSIEREGNPMVYAKYHHAGMDWTWWAMAFDGENIFYGLVLGYDCECGHFTLKEFEDIARREGQAVQRDPTFEPCRVSELFPMHRIR